MSELEDIWHRTPEERYEDNMASKSDEISRLRTEVEKLRDSRTRHLETETKLVAEVERITQVRHDLNAAVLRESLRAEAAERKLAMAVEALRAARKGIIMLSPNPDGVLGMQALHAVKLIDAALAELEKDDG